MIWPNQNQPTLTLHSHPTADYWASDPDYKYIHTVYITVCVSQCVYGKV